MTSTIHTTVYILCLFLFSFVIVIHSSFDVIKENRELSNYVRKIISFVSVDYNQTQDFDTLLSSPTCKPHHCKADHERHGTVKVLLLGDSVDRNMVSDFCHGNPIYNFSSNWANIYYGNGGGNAGSSCCTSPHFILCNAHIFGSAAKGPYQNGYQNNANDLHVDTELRIPQCMHDFITQFGHPEFVLLRTELWDMGTLEKVILPRRNTTAVDLRELSTEFIANYRNALKIIRHWSPSALLGSHNVPKPSFPTAFFHAYLHAMRYLSEEVRASYHNRIE